MKKNIKLLDPVYPGRILKEEFMDPLNISMYKLAKDIRVQAISISYIIQGKRRISPEMALRLAKYFNTSEQFWLHLQEKEDIRVAFEKVGDEVENIHPFALVEA
jgi:addiction module HigA family antidote